MLKKAFFFSAIIVTVLAVSPTQATPVAEVSTSTAYQTILDSDSDTSYLVGIPATTESLSEHSDHSTYHYAEARGNATIAGQIGVYSYVMGWYDVTPPAPPESQSIDAVANASQTAAWFIDSDTLAPGTPVVVLMDVTFDAALEIPYGGWMTVNADVVKGGINIYEAGMASHDLYVVEGSGAWVGDLQEIEYYLYSLDVTDRIGFNAVVGETFELAISLDAEVFLEEPFFSEGAIGVADFWNSGLYTFAGAEDPLDPGTMLDVDFEMVPEPTTLLLLGLGVLGLIRKHRA